MTMIEPQPPQNQKDLPALAKLWGKRYVQGLLDPSRLLSDRDRFQLAEVASLEGRVQTAATLRGVLNFASAQAWAKTEGLLAEEVQRHRIDVKLINPWQIAEDSHQLFEKLLDVYQQGKAPQTLATVIGPECGRVRKGVTAEDPRLLGFVSMQIHYTGERLLEAISSTERLLVQDYLKVLDDHLYMPLHRAYEAAGKKALHSIDLTAVQSLLPQSGQIAQDICSRVVQTYGTYRSQSGLLKDFKVLVSSIRDVEMFQIYLCVCLLEGSIAAFQEELFPLCVMLYPPLQVEWWLVRLLVEQLEEAFDAHLSTEIAGRFRPYLTAMQELFAAEVVGT